MEIGKRRLEDDHMSGNRSFGSNYHPCSQTRKISIGVMVDSSAKMKSQIGKGVVTDAETTGNVNMSKDHTTEIKQNKAPSQKFSPPVLTKTSYQNVSRSEATGHQKNVSSLPSTTNVSLQPSGSKVVGEMEPGSYFANQMLKFQGMNANEIKSKNSIYHKEKESSYTTPQKEFEPKKGIAEQGISGRGNSGPVTLRMKVQELLETVYSPTKRQPNSETFGINANNSKPTSTANGNDSLHTRKTNSETFGIGANNLKQKPTTNGNDSLHTRKTNSGTFGVDAINSKPKSTTNGNDSLHTRKTNSETFEFDANNSKPKSTTNGNDSLHSRKTNSGSLGKLRRPMTRSLTAKKPQVQKSAPKKQTPLFQSKQAQFEENAFSFVETWSKRPTTEVDHGFKSFKRKERERFGTTVQATDVKKTKATAIDVSLFKDRARDGEKVNPDTEMKERDIFGMRVKASDDKRKASDEKKTKAAAIDVSLFKDRARDGEKVNPDTERKERDIFGMRVKASDDNRKASDEKKTKAATINVSLFRDSARDSDTAKPNTGGNNGSVSDVEVDSFANDSLKDNVEPTFELKTAANIFFPISMFQINKEYNDVDSPVENSFRTKRTHSSNSKGFFTKNISMDLQVSPVTKPDREANNRSRSPSKEMESESSESEDDPPVTAPVISPSQDEDSESESSEDDSPIKGDADCDKFDDSLEQDGFAGAVKLFAMALERVQSKIHSSTSKQSAAILLSVSKNIQSQLQDAESKIQNEVGKLTNLAKSKRMHPENQYQEQQEQLKHIYEKFKEEVDQHLEKCKNTLEGLEAHQIQVKGMVEKQRLSHKNILIQTEEVIEKQLNDAQKRLADVHRMAKEKMFKLKYGIAECLKEGLLA